MTFNTIIYERDGPIAAITLNRPDKLNAINGPMVLELNEALDRAERDDEIRVILLNGAGRAFSAGFDLDMDGEGHDVASMRRELTRDFDIIMRFWDSAKPTIAAVHKYCLGSAMEMAVACDITIASDDCRFGAPEVQFGSGIVALLLPWLIGPKHAKELLLIGNDRVSADRAAEIGLVNKVVRADALDKEAREMARLLALNDPVAVRLTKQAINRTYDVMGLRAALHQALELDIVIETTETPDSKEFNAILKKSGPRAALAWRRKRLLDGVAAPGRDSTKSEQDG